MHAAQRRLEKVDVLVPVGMPLRVSAATTTAPDGRDMSTLTYSITNVSGKNLSDSQLAVFIVGPCGCITGGEGWNQQLDLQPHSNKTFSMLLKHAVTIGSHAVLTIQRTSGQAGIWEVELPDLSKAAKVLVSTKTIALPTAQYIPSGLKNAHAAPPQGAYCIGALASAKDACGDAGLASFSCDDKNQTFSFTCKSKGPGEILE